MGGVRTTPIREAWSGWEAEGEKGSEVRRKGESEVSLEAGEFGVGEAGQYGDGRGAEAGEDGFGEGAEGEETTAVGDGEGRRGGRRGGSAGRETSKSSGVGGGEAGHPAVNVDHGVVGLGFSREV